MDGNAVTVSFSMPVDELASGLAESLSYEELLQLFEFIDDMQMDSAFTDMVYAAFEKRSHGIENS